MSNVQKTYSEEELKQKLEQELEKEMEEEFEISKFDDKKRDLIITKKDGGLRVKLIYEIQEEIGEKKSIN